MNTRKSLIIQKQITSKQVDIQQEKGTKREQPEAINRYLINVMIDHSTTETRKNQKLFHRKTRILFFIKKTFSFFIDFLETRIP